MFANANLTSSGITIDADAAVKLEWIVLQLLRGGNSLRYCFFAFLSSQPMWVAGAVAMRLGELTTDPDPERSRQAAAVLATFAERLGSCLQQGLRHPNHSYRQHCRAALNVCLPYLTPAR